MPAKHGDLPSTSEYFSALGELLHTGATGGPAAQSAGVRARELSSRGRWSTTPARRRSTAGEAVARGLLGGSPRRPRRGAPKRRLEVKRQGHGPALPAAADLLGHYEQDPIAGAEALIDRELLDGDLSERYNLGLYAGPLGTASVVLRVPNEQERRRGSLTGADRHRPRAYDGNLSVGDLIEAVRAGVLRYLLQVIDVLGADRANCRWRRCCSATTLRQPLGRGFGRGAGARRHRRPTHVSTRRHDSISASVASTSSSSTRIRRSPPPMRCGGCPSGSRRTDPALRRGAGLSAGTRAGRRTVRRRLFDSGSPSYWPRLIVTDADREEAWPSAPACRPAGDTGQGGAARDRARRSPNGCAFSMSASVRAPSRWFQRQPGLVEMLVRQQIHSRCGGGFRPRALPADGAARLQGRGATARGSCWWSTTTRPTCRGS
jgi:hypothetical protein